MTLGNFAHAQFDIAQYRPATLHPEGTVMTLPINFIV